MIAIRTLLRLALIPALICVIGCGGSPPEVDTAELIRTEPATKNASEPSTAPALTPDAAPPKKEAPKN